MKSLFGRKCWRVFASIGIDLKKQIGSLVATCSEIYKTCRKPRARVQGLLIAGRAGNDGAAIGNVESVSGNDSRRQ